MYSKVLKVVWIISMLAASATLFYAYAGFQENVSLGVVTSVVDKDWVFYFILLLMALLNTSALVLPRVGVSRSVVGWYFGLLATFHLFLISVFIVMGILNSRERYNFDQLGPLVYASFILFVVWLFSFFFLPRTQGSSSR